MCLIIAHTVHNVLVQAFLLNMNVWTQAFTLPTRTINIRLQHDYKALIVKKYINAHILDLKTNVWSQRTKSLVSKTLEFLKFLVSN